jgi:hypothetical protein
MLGTEARSAIQIPVEMLVSFLTLAARALLPSEISALYSASTLAL